MYLMWNGLRNSDHFIELVLLQRWSLWEVLLYIDIDLGQCSCKLFEFLIQKKMIPWSYAVITSVQVFGSIILAVIPHLQHPQLMIGIVLQHVKRLRDTYIAPARRNLEGKCCSVTWKTSARSMSGTMWNVFQHITGPLIVCVFTLFIF